MPRFLIGLFLSSAGTMAYEIVLTRILSTVSWYYLAFIAVTMAMFGMTVGALLVQLWPEHFRPEDDARRRAQAAFAMGVSLPFTLCTVLSVPIELSRTAQTLYTIALFSALNAVPFVFSGVVVCLSLTRAPAPIGRVYAVDLIGAAVGSVGAIGLLSLVDGPSAVLAIAGVVFVAAWSFAREDRELALRLRAGRWAIGLLVLAAINAATPWGIRPIWAKGRADDRVLLAEEWNPISTVQARGPRVQPIEMWGPSPLTPNVFIDTVRIDIDHGASTALMPWKGRREDFAFLRYDVTSVGMMLRRGGASAAVVGVGGGRDVLAAVTNGFERIVGIEVNDAIVDIASRRLDAFSGFSKIPGLELHVDEGRSWFARAQEKFDLVQLSMVDTWAATAAGAMALTENGLYTVEAFESYCRALKPGGLLCVARWDAGSDEETSRTCAVAWAALLRSGVERPADHVVIVSAGRVATLLLCQRPFTQAELSYLRDLAATMQWSITLQPGREPAAAALKRLVAATSLGELAKLRQDGFDFSPVYDSSPFFFSAIRLADVTTVVERHSDAGGLRALALLLGFIVVTVALIAVAIVWPLRRTGGSAPAIGLTHFIALGLGFMLAEIGMMQRLSLFLGHPIYALVVVLAGLIVTSGLGSLASDRVPLGAARLPTIVAGLALVGYSFAVAPATGAFMGALLARRAAVALALIAPVGVAMGSCFPVGLRRMVASGQEGRLAWLWGLNGAASVLATPLALLVSMETSTRGCVLCGAFCYAVAAISVPRSRG
jgi:SAM-dependent methyltransferase